VRLINRTIRRLALTAEGEIYLARSRDILEAIEAAESEIASARVLPRGHLRVHAFPSFAVDKLAPILPEFLARYPRITIDFLLTNRFVDVIGENEHFGRGQLNDSTLIAREIVDLTRIVCASPDYLASHGRPIRPSDLVRNSCLTMSHIPGGSIWQFRIDGELVPVNVKGPVSADSADMLSKLAIASAGIIRQGDPVVAPAIQKGLLEPVLQDAQEPGDFPLALLPPGRQRLPKVRVFLDFLIERFGSAPWRHGSLEMITPQVKRRRRRWQIETTYDGITSAMAPFGHGRSGRRCPFTRQKQTSRLKAPRPVDDPVRVKTQKFEALRE
jgi:DNA-binding transcriptional LysR family regulator